MAALRAALYILAALLPLALAWRVDGPRHELAGYADEPAHAVNALLVRDYLASHIGQDPKRFALDYYEHYPKVTIGIWGPVAPAVFGSWLLAFGASAASLLAAAGAVVLALGLLIHRGCAAQGVWPGLFGAAIFGASAVTVWNANAVMADALVGLWCWLALLSFARWAEGGGRRWAIGFGLLSACAVLTKANGVVALGVPFGFVLARRDWRRTRDVWFWIPLALAAALAGPWQWYSAKLVAEAVVLPEPGWDTLWQNFTDYVKTLPDAVGFAGIALAGAGAWRTFRNPASPLSSAALGLLLASAAFHVVAPHQFSPRYLMASLGAWSATAAVGAAGAGRAWTAAAIAAILLGAIRYPYEPKPWLGFDRVALETMARPGTGPILVSSDAMGEGALISGIALRDRRPGRTILRASKVLAKSSWEGLRRDLLFEEPADAMRYLESRGTRLAVLQPTEDSRLEWELLQRVIAEYPERWRKLRTWSHPAPKVELWELR